MVFGGICAWWHSCPTVLSGIFAPSVSGANFAEGVWWHVCLKVIDGTFAPEVFGGAFSPVCLTAYLPRCVWWYL
jgi:hypothetical protein